MMSCQYNILDLGETYISSQIKIQDENGQTALMFAAKSGSLELA